MCVVAWAFFSKISLNSIFMSTHQTHKKENHQNSTLFYMLPQEPSTPPHNSMMKNPTTEIPMKSKLFTYPKSQDDAAALHWLIILKYKNPLKLLSYTRTLHSTFFLNVSHSSVKNFSKKKLHIDSSSGEECDRKMFSSSFSLTNNHRSSFTWPVSIFFTLCLEWQHYILF